MKKTVLAFLLVCLFAGCEKGYMGEEESIADPQGNVTLRVTAFEQMPFDELSVASRATAVSDICTRLNFAVFSGSEKVKSFAQRVGDADFGTVSMMLAEGTYTVVAIAHSSDKSVSISDPAKIGFENPMTDTFYYYGQIVVGSEASTYDLALNRATAMFRLKINDAMPANVRNMKFYYTGGSASLNATTGYGNVNSKQTVNIEVPESMAGQPTQFEVYTFQHEDKTPLKITITAQDANGNDLNEKKFEDVPIERNKITMYSGNFFDNGLRENSFTINVEDAWEGTTEVDF